MKNIAFMPTKNKKIEVQYKVKALEETYSMHIHNDYEIYMSLCNNNKFCVGHKIYDVNKNDVFLFNNTDVHKINVSDPANYSRYVVMFSPSIFSEAEPELSDLLQCFDGKNPNCCHKLSLSDEQAADFLFILRKMTDCECEGVSNSFLKLRLYLSQLLLLVQDIRRAAPAIASVSDTEDHRLNEIMGFLRERCTDTITLEELSGKFFLNKYYLCRMFKNKLGFGIGEYIESCRLSKAIPMLREGMPVSAVARNTGFCSDSYFISIFKKHLGMSPKKYLRGGAEA